MKNAPSRSDGRFIMDRTLRNDFTGHTIDTNTSRGVVPVSLFEKIGELHASGLYLTIRPLSSSAAWPGDDRGNVKGPY